MDNPYTGDIVTEIQTLTQKQAEDKVALAEKAFQQWKTSTLQTRQQLIRRWLDAMSKEGDAIALSVSEQMGKPLGQAKGELETAIKRARALVEMAPRALAEHPITQDPQPNLLRKITKEPIGVVLALCPWNYPLLCAVNSVVTAVLCGDSVLLKHSERTPLVADAFERAFAAAGAPAGLVQAFHADNALVARIVSHPTIKYVQFTGSVTGGRAVYKAVAEKRFIDVGLELGGKDPAYIAADADLNYAIPNVVDGGLFNAGQSCCAIERVYVHEKHYDAFLDGARKLMSEYVLGSPLDSSTTLGPIAQPHHPALLKQHVDDARQHGARILIGGEQTTDKAGKGRFFQPTLVADATHEMRAVAEESFGPMLTVTKVSDDEEALRLMNDSCFGLTASVWTNDLERATRLASGLEAGTVFMNRSDFLDPYLSWSGRKDSGKGIGLSEMGFAPFVRTKSWNFRPSTK